MDPQDLLDEITEEINRKTFTLGLLMREGFPQPQTRLLLSQLEGLRRSYEEKERLYFSSSAGMTRRTRYRKS